MSRELKFRAWSKDGGKFYYDAEETYDGLVGANHTSFGTLLEDNNYIVEQYTGLKDKNGREIYEGDIVRATYFEAHYRALKVGKKRKITGKIIYGSACFFIESISDETPLLQVGGSENIEVIGNIHENPELLGGKE